MHAPTLHVLVVQLAHWNSPIGDRKSHQFENPQPRVEPSLQRDLRRTSYRPQLPQSFIERLLWRDSEECHELD